MLAAETGLKQAEKVKGYLLKQQLLHPNYLLVKEFDKIYFPILREAKIPGAVLVNTQFAFPERKKTLTLEELLNKKLTQEQLTILPRSQEIVGKILILEIPSELKSKEKLIAEAYLKIHPEIETVVKKEKMHEGLFRTRKVRILAGKQTKETIHQESGVKLKLHLEKTYFSARSGNERLRVANQVKRGEEILVMFSGCGPYTLVLAKNTPAQKVLGIEINSWAHYYATENITLNHLQGKASVLLGDVRLIMPKMKEKFDRILMPLPKTGEEFLDLALTKIKTKGIIHLYSFLRESEIAAYRRKIREICQKEKHEVKIMRVVKCGQFSPHVFRVCFDLRVEK